MDNDTFLADLGLHVVGLEERIVRLEGLYARRAEARADRRDELRAMLQDARSCPSSLDALDKYMAYVRASEAWIFAGDV